MLGDAVLLYLILYLNYRYQSRVIKIIKKGLDGLLMSKLINVNLNLVININLNLVINV